MTDPEARLAAALASYRDHNGQQTWDNDPETVEEFYGKPSELVAWMLQSDPTIAADLDLGAAARVMPPGGVYILPDPFGPTRAARFEVYPDEFAAALEKALTDD